MERDYYGKGGLTAKAEKDCWTSDLKFAARKFDSTVLQSNAYPLEKIFLFKASFFCTL